MWAELPGSAQRPTGQFVPQATAMILVCIACSKPLEGGGLWPIPRRKIALPSHCLGSDGRAVIAWISGIFICF